jgi:phosphate starvation-inducible protein PhoH and related proteins
MHKTIYFKDFDELMYVLGPEDKNLKKLRHDYNVKIWARGHSVVIEGKTNRVNLVEKLLQESIAQMYNKEKPAEKNTHDLPETSDNKYEAFFINYRHKSLYPRSKHQFQYIELLKNKDLVFGIGPAGTGKTFLAVAVALKMLAENKIERIVLTRPVIEAGEKLGFLPGDLTEKMNPYIKPLEDAFKDLIGAEKYKYYHETGIIEIVPLAYMRGRTLNNCFIIFDEAQNSTSKQMLMFLTRLGANSKAAITGDSSQIDLDNNKLSGLIEAEDVLKDIKDIKFVYFSEKDVLRHELVKKVILAYTKKRESLTEGKQ